MSSSKIEVSVIIPVYNVERYLPQCLDSILNQTLKEIEIVCINDGSTDKSLRILEKYKSNDSRVKIYTKENSGYGKTINWGLEKSHGKYIVIVDSDDFMDSDGIRVLYDCAEANQADYVRSNYFEYKDGQDTLNSSLDIVLYNKMCNALENPQLFYNIAMSTWACIYKKSFLIDNNIKMNETPGAAFQDTSWQYMVLLRARRIVFIKEAYYHYRIDNPDSSINNPKMVFFEVDEKNYMEIKLKEYKIIDPNIWTAFSRMIYVLYKWNYSIIAAEYQYAFLLEWKNEITRQKNLGYLIKDVFEESQWNEIDHIFNDADSYFKETAKAYSMKNVYKYTLNDQMYYDGFINKLIHNKYSIFGTGAVTQELVKLLQKKECLDNIICFCETDPSQKKFFHKSIFSIRNFPYAKEELIICSTIEKTQKCVVNELKEMGFSNILSIDNRLRKRIKLDIG